MRTVGQIFKDARLKKGFTIEQAEKSTKIRSKFLRALEADDFSNLPEKTYIQGFIKNYADFLGVSTHTLLALFRRQYKRREREQKTLEEPLSQSPWRPTPNRVVVSLVIILVAVLLSYFYLQFKALHAPPPLEVAGPRNESVFTDETVAVYGTTDPDVTLTINDEPVLVSENGKFYKEMPLAVGTNTIVVEAVTRVGEKTTEIRRITRLPETE